MAKKTTNEEKEIEVGEIVSRSEEFIEKHKKKIIAGISAVAVVIGLILAYHYLYAKPQAERPSWPSSKANNTWRWTPLRWL